MAAIGEIAARRHETLRHVLDTLGLDLPIPSTKSQQVVLEKFYLDLLAELAKRVVALERAHDADRINRLEEAVATLLRRKAPVRKAER